MRCRATGVAKNSGHSVVIAAVAVILTIVVKVVSVGIVVIGLSCNQPSLLIRALPSALSLGTKILVKVVILIIVVIVIRPCHSAYTNCSHSIVVILITVLVLVVVVVIIVIIVYIGLGCNQPSLLIRAQLSALSLGEYTKIVVVMVVLVVIVMVVMPIIFVKKS